MAQREKLALFLVIACATAGYAVYFNVSAVPYPDFFAYREHALWYLDGRLPEYFKRLPLFPLLIAGLSVVLPGPEPELLAAQLINLALAPVCLWLLSWVVSRFVSPRAVLLVVALFAANWAMAYSATQANVEMVLLATVLLVIDLALRGSAWVYPAAFLASLTRPEISCLIPLVVLHDWVQTSGVRRRKSLLWGALASVGIVGWLALSMRHAPGLSQQPYMHELMVRHGSLLAFPAGALRLLSSVVPGGLLQAGLVAWTVKGVAAGLVLAGSVVLARRHKGQMIVPLGFTITYTAVHTVFPSYLDRYVMPVLWIYFLAMAAAVEPWLSRVRRSGPVALAGGVVALTMVASSALASVGRMNTYEVRAKRLVFRLAGEWYRDHARPGDQLVTTVRRVVKYYSGHPEQVFYAGELKAEALEPLLHELIERGVTYVVWDNIYEKPNSYDAINHKGYLITLLKEQYPQGLQPVAEFTVGHEHVIVYRFRPPEAISP